MSATRVAIAHDYLTQRGGAERVVLTMTRAFPGAPVFTMLHDAASTFPEFAGVPVRSSWLSRIAALRRHHRLAFPLLAPVASTTRIDADVVLCSSSGWAHGIRTAGHRVVYCHAPARWLYQQRRYTQGHALGDAAVRVLGPPLRRWDRSAARRADRYLANSTVVARAVQELYGIEAEVLPPPVTLDVDGATEPVPDVEPGALLCVARLLPYKNLGALMEAFARLPAERLVVVGDGPDAKRLRAGAPPNVQLIGTVSDAQLRWLYECSSGLVAAAYEDFGLTPLESASFGRPAAVLRAGGYLDTVVEGTTGVAFDAPEPSAIVDAVKLLRATRWDEHEIRQHADHFSEARFCARLQAIVSEYQ